MDEILAFEHPLLKVCWSPRPASQRSRCRMSSFARRSKVAIRSSRENSSRFCINWAKSRIPVHLKARQSLVPLPRGFKISAKRFSFPCFIFDPQNIYFVKAEENFETQKTLLEISAHRIQYLQEAPSKMYASHSPTPCSPFSLFFDCCPLYHLQCFLSSDCNL